MNAWLTNLAYLAASVMFIYGLKFLSSPRTARQGNLLGACGMLLAIVVTLTDRQILDYRYIGAGLAVGSCIGAAAAAKVKMTAMPQLVGILNGFGGGASVLVAYSEYLRMSGSHTAGYSVLITIVASLVIGSVTFSGSAVAFIKLQGIAGAAPVLFPFQKHLNALQLAAILALGAWFVLNPELDTALMLITGLSLLLGVLSVIPIGGADMPVVISLLNSYSGIAAAATGFVLQNNMLIIGGTLVGASGIFLTRIMCKAMNRSLANVLFAGVGSDYESAGAAAVEQKALVQYTPDDAAYILENAASVIIVPGYGLAVAQAQHALQELAALLTGRGVSVRYAIHPVAGRMPGHMNVLLAEANVPYDLLAEMDAINEDFQNTDVALVVGANDVVNPAARHKKDSPLFGMPILNVDRARTAIVCKRSLRPGFAGEDNELFYDRKTMMVFGDAKDTLTAIAQILKKD